MTQSDGLLTATHWGNFRVRVDSQGELEAVPSESDLSPSLIGRNLRATRNRDCRIARPMVREGYLRQGRNSDGSDRGRERFVALDWDEALDLAAEAIRDVRARRFQPSTAVLMAGRAPDASIMPRARCTASSTASAVTSAMSIPTASALVV